MGSEVEKSNQNTAKVIADILDLMKAILHLNCDTDSRRWMDVDGGVEPIVAMRHGDYAEMLEQMIEMAHNPGDIWRDILNDLRGETDSSLQDMSRNIMEGHLTDGAFFRIPKDFPEIGLSIVDGGEATLEYDTDDWLLEGQQLSAPMSLRLFMLAWCGSLEALGVESSGTNLPRR